jgi:DNA adenine methylase
MKAPSRPLLRWHGGKWRLAPWILSLMPPHRVYVEPFAGGASVLLRKERAYSEVLNDLDENVVGLFRILRDPASAARLRLHLELTPYARREFEQAYRPAKDPVERARRMIVWSFMGFGSNAHVGKPQGPPPTGFRANSTRSYTTPAHDWANYPAVIDAVAGRLAGVVIEARPALDVIAAHDGPDTLHYLDPPYPHDTRSLGNKWCPKHLYRHEMTLDDHAALLDAAAALTGMVMISTYPNPLYADRLAAGGWVCREREALADGARARVEQLWLNPAAVARHDRRAAPLLAFGGAA